MAITKDNISGGQLDTLIALVEKGPLFDGDVPSKSARDTLVEEGYAAKIVVKGQDGYQAATYKGRSLYQEVFGNSDTIAEAKAYRIAKRTINNSSSDAKNVKKFVIEVKDSDREKSSLAFLFDLPSGYHRGISVFIYATDVPFDDSQKHNEVKYELEKIRGIPKIANTEINELTQIRSYYPVRNFGSFKYIVVLADAAKLQVAPECLGMIHNWRDIQTFEEWKVSNENKNEGVKPCKRF